MILVVVGLRSSAEVISSVWSQGMRKFLVLGLEGSEEEEESSSSVWNGVEREKEGGDVSFVSFLFFLCV